MKSAIILLVSLALPASPQEARLALRELTGEAIKNNPEIVAAQKA